MVLKTSLIRSAIKITSNFVDLFAIHSFHMILRSEHKCLLSRINIVKCWSYITCSGGSNIILGETIYLHFDITLFLSAFSKGPYKTHNLECNVILMMELISLS